MLITGRCEVVAEAEYKSFQRHSGQHAEPDVLHDVVRDSADATGQSTVHRGP